MKALQFLKSLLPNFAKQTVLDDIRITRMVLTTVTIPTYDNALRLFGSRKLVNASLLQDWDVYRRNVKGVGGSNTIVAIEKNLKPMLTTLDLIERLVEKDYNDDIEGSGVTYYKAAVLQMQESVSFAADFALKYLNYAVILESTEIRDRDEDEDVSLLEDLTNALTPAEIRFIHERFLDFCTVMDTLSKPTEKIKVDFESIPDIAITDSGDNVVTKSVGESKLDPFRHGFVPLAMNPIYHVRMKIADWQHYRYEKAKAEKEALELRILRMQKLLQNKADPALEKQIEYTQKRIDDLVDHLRKVEQQYG